MPVRPRRLLAALCAANQWTRSVKVSECFSGPRLAARDLLGRFPHRIAPDTADASAELPPAFRITRSIRRFRARSSGELFGTRG